ncbi:MAG TPA: ATP synthase F1 subunit gamma [Myxococcales bacterium]|nr:ATP synthase F1 subunit gamma [Myxococcales bacterium]
MASLRTIRNRIRSVRNTQKITKAMKMLAAAKLRRAQDAVIRARPYAQLIEEMLASLAEARARDELPPHPLMAVRPERRVEVVMLTSDRGLAGGFNSNIIRRGQRFMTEEGGRLERIQFATVGRRGRDFAKKRGFTTRKDYVGFFGKLSYGQAREIANDLITAYQKDELDAVYLLYNYFRSTIAQEIMLVRLLPLEPKKRTQNEQGTAAKGLLTPEHIFEPSRPAVLQSLLPRFLAVQIWRALVESEASEHAARMTAMDSATKNASEMIGRLTLEYNRARQAAITKELMEIVSGAEALK